MLYSQQVFTQYLEAAALYTHPPNPHPHYQILLELTFSAISLGVCRDLGQGNFVIFISEVRRLRMRDLQ